MGGSACSIDSCASVKSSVLIILLTTSSSGSLSQLMILIWHRPLQLIVWCWHGWSPPRGRSHTGPSCTCLIVKMMKTVKMIFGTRPTDQNITLPKLPIDRKWFAIDQIERYLSFVKLSLAPSGGTSNWIGKTLFNADLFMLLSILQIDISVHRQLPLFASKLSRQMCLIWSKHFQPKQFPVTRHW